jgi:uncharacterized protein YkwD
MPPLEGPLPVTRLVRRAAASVALLTAAFGVSAAVSVVTEAPASASITWTAADYSTENQITRLVNVKRAAAHCGALRTDDRLRVAARRHSRDMVLNNFFAHNGTDGSTFVTRAQVANYWAAGAENIAWGYSTPTAVVNAWMNSTVHRTNLLNCSLKAVGVGVARKSDGTPYWTQDFGRS